VEPISREIVARIAKIIGPDSGAQKALNDLDARLAAGEDVVIFQGGSALIVGPAPPPKTSL
jgi:hypothetical protein